MHFQLCSPNQYEDINHGWIHHDGQTLYAGVLYLTPDAPLNTGTSLYKKRNDCLDFSVNDFAALPNSKHELYLNFNPNNIEQYKNMIEENNSKFIEFLFKLNVR
jgi:hypothetical protein